MKSSSPTIFFVSLKKKKIIYGCAGSLLLHMGLSLVAVSKGYSPVAVHGLLIVVVSLAVEHRLENTGIAVVEHRLNCPVACGISPEEGSNLCPLHWHGPPAKCCDKFF